MLGVRQMPNVTKDDLIKLLPIASMNAFGHACTVNAMFEVSEALIYYIDTVFVEMFTV